MINCGSFFEILSSNGVAFFSGVPDSLLKNFCSYLMDHVSSRKHVIAANEGNAVGLAIGHYLATGNVPLVYLQNSGQGNVINPIASLSDPDVYGIPMVLLIGWRGEPTLFDEPQHKKQGEITFPLFETMGIPASLLPDDEDALSGCVENAVRQAVEEKRPVALVVRKGLIERYELQKKTISKGQITRESAIESIVNGLDRRAVVVATTGKISRELYEIRERKKSGHQSDFLVVGGMGHASQIAAGIALEKPDRQVLCLDGDGAALMHMGGLGILASLNLPNYKHVVLNNGAHDSVGGQPTVGFNVNFAKIADACGYASTVVVHDEKELDETLPTFFDATGPAFLEVQVALGSRADLGRPQTSPQHNKRQLMEFLHD